MGSTPTLPTTPTPLAEAHAPLRAHRIERAWLAWWFHRVPVRRLDVFGRIVAAIVLFQVLWADSWAFDHRQSPRAFYTPVNLARWLRIPAPTNTTMWILVAVSALSAAAMMVRRWQRPAAAVALPAHVLWLIWAFSWGKVDHDRLTILVALAVLALAPRTEVWAGWALRTVQVVFVLSYPMSAIAKMRWSGPQWMDSAVFATALVRRGTAFGDLFLPHPGLLRAAQWGMIIFELAAVFALVSKPVIRVPLLVGVVFLHLVTVATLGISFLPHSLLLVAFLPLEKLSRGRTRIQGEVPGGVLG